MHHHTELFIDGRWVRSRGERSIDVVNPATERVIGSAPDATLAEVDEAVKAARRAYDAWSATPSETRAGLLETLERGLKARADELAQLICAEVGTPIKMSHRLQVALPLGTLAVMRQVLREYAFEERVGNSLIVREPIGVVACVTPWNYPLHQIMCKVGPALAAGCTVVLKPSEVAPLSAFVLAEEIAAAGFPPGVFNLVTGLGSTVGEELARHPDVDMISFTGSTRAGRRVSEVASGTIKRVALELGGKSASILLDDADFGAAVKTTVNMCLLNSGQTCAALTRLLVPEDRYAEAAQLAVATAQAFLPGDPTNEKTRLGPLTTRLQRERVSDYIRQGIGSGAEVLLGEQPLSDTRGNGFFVSPVVFGRVDPGHTIAQEEIFGPVLCIMTYKDEDEAVRIANATPFGLAAAVWSGSDARAERVARRLKAGQVDLNGGAFNQLAPFGGYRQSGNGRENGKFGFEEMLETKALQLRA